MGEAAIAYDPIYDPFDPRMVVDPYPVYRTLRDEHPVYYNQRLDVYVLSRYEDIFRALRTPQIFSSAEGLTPTKNEIAQLGLAPTFIMMDPPDHTRLRRLITKVFTPDTVKAMEAEIRAFVIDLIEAAKRKAADGVPVDLIQDIASPIPTKVVADILGVPEADREQFDPWSDAIVSATADIDLQVNEAIGAVTNLFQYFTEMCQARRQAPRDDMITKLTQAEVEGETLTDWDILGFCFVMITGGNDTTTNLLGSAARLLDEHPDQRRVLYGDHSLIGSATEEFLRLEAPVQGLSRFTMQDVELHGVTIPKGNKVHNLYAAGNRDPRHWGDDAEELDIRRDAGRHLSFTQGPHFCIGAHVARLMIRTYFEEFSQRIGENIEFDWDNAVRRSSAFTRGYQSIPIRIKA